MVGLKAKKAFLEHYDDTLCVKATATFNQCCFERSVRAPFFVILYTDIALPQWLTGSCRQRVF